MQFGFTLKPEHSIERTLALTRQAEAALRVRLAVRQSRAMARPVPAADAHGRRDVGVADGDLRDEPGHPRTVGDRVVAGGARRGQRRPDGPGHRRGDSARRCSASRRSRWPTPRRRSPSSGRWSPVTPSRTRVPELHFPWTRGWTLPIWVAGYGPIRDDRPRSGRDHPPARGHGPRPLVRGTAAGRRGGRWTAGGIDQGPVRGTRPRRPARPRARADTLVPGARVEPCGRSRQQVPRSEQLLDALTGYITDRSGYDYRHHAEVGSSNAAFVGDEVTRSVLHPRLGRRA